MKNLFYFLAAFITVFSIVFAIYGPKTLAFSGDFQAYTKIHRDINSLSGK